MSRHRSPSPASALVEQIARITGPGTGLRQVQEREWASATFAGARYIIDLSVPTGGGSLLPAIAALPEHEFILPGQIVADCSVNLGGLVPGETSHRELRVELLTVVAD
jgi:hypothetical protein